MEQFEISIICNAEQEAVLLKQQLEQGLKLQSAVACIGDEYICKANASQLPSSDKGNMLLWMSQELARFIIRHKENTLLKRIIAVEYHDYNALEADRIYQYCLQQMEQPDNLAHDRRFGKASQAIAACLEEMGGDLHMEGLLRFRLRSYLDELRDVVECAVDAFIMDKQYEEFIALLKYFVYVQDAKIPVVHLIHNGSYEFILLDERMAPMKPKQMEGLVLERVDQDLNYEDMIVSTLITVSPARLYIHTRDENSQVIRTILQIFSERAEVCLTCPECSLYLDEDVRLDHEVEAIVWHPLQP